MDPENTGTEPNAPAPDAAAIAAAAGAAAAKPDTQTKGDNAGKTAEGSTVTAGVDVFADLEADTREWLQKREVKDAKAAAKLAFDQSKLLGNAIRIPGPKATDEEKAEFLNKLGRPEKADDYEFEMPKDLPAEIPYDGERAAKFKSLMHEQGLNKTQAKALHDAFIADTVGDYHASAVAQVEALKTTAKEETGKLEKLWGPLNGETAQANLEFADRFIMETVGEDGWAELERLKAVTTVDGKRVVTSAKMAEMFAKAGMALFKEGSIVTGDPAFLGNPFAEGEHFNLTKQMQLTKADPDRARQMIAAAGKKPADFGMTG